MVPQLFTNVDLPGLVEKKTECHQRPEDAYGDEHPRFNTSETTIAR